MSLKDGFLDLVNQDGDWQESGQRLLQILKEVKEKVGESPMRITEAGEVYLHPEVNRILHEPGNEGPLEFLRCIERTGISERAASSFTSFLLNVKAI
jgi:hypothetical protein